MSRSLRPALLSAAGRALAGFVLGLGFWFAFTQPYERLLAEAAEWTLRATERPPITRLSARGGEILIERSDLAPATPTPGLPAADLHFNFALLAALFAIDRRPWRSENVAAFLMACGILFVVHAAALVFQVRSVYVTGLGDWSAARYGLASRTFWSGGFHLYLIAGRFAAPFAIWWLLTRGRTEGAAWDGERGRTGQPLRLRSRRR
jgi:hypothetical protein